MAKQALLTLRDYAKKLGTSHQTVSAAIKNGKISDGYDEKTQKINPAIADLEWGLEFSQQQAIKQAAKMGGMDGEDDEPITQFDGEIPRNAKSAELFRLKLYFETRKAQITVLESEGKLIDKAETYRQLYAWGQSLKNELNGLADRILDDVLAADRDSAKLIFDKEVHRVLEIMAGYDAEFDPGNM